MIEAQLDYTSWDTLVRCFQENTFKVHFKSGVLAKKAALFSCGFGLKKNKEDDTTLHTIFEIHNSSEDVPNSLTCKITNNEWKGNYMVRDGRDQPSGTFGYNSSGGEKIKVVFATPVKTIIKSSPVRFYARLYVVGKDKQEGKLLGMYSENGGLRWGHKDLTEVVEVVSTDWS